jgi:hypothetical protein
VVAVPVVALLSVLTVRSFAIVILPGGGPLPNGNSVRTDCFVHAEMQGNVTAMQEMDIHDKYIRCTDGDPTCDQDGQCNGSCEFRARICTGQPQGGQPEIPHCTYPHSLDALHINKQCPMTAPATLTGSVCGAFVDFDVPLTRKGGPRNLRCQARAKAEASVRPRLDRDVFVFSCLPRTGPCPVQPAAEEPR